MEEKIPVQEEWRVSVEALAQTETPRLSAGRVREPTWEEHVFLDRGNRRQPLA